MATTATSASSSTSTATADAQAAAAAKRASAQKIITSLSAGSGVDVAALAQGLVDAERAPQENVINTKITKNEARVSGYAAVKFMLGNVKDALTGLKDANSFNASSVSNSNTSALSVTAGTAADLGSHAVAITTLASAQRNISTNFASSSDALNAGSGFTLDLTIGSDAAATITVEDGYDTPQGLVNAINTADLAVTARLVNTGSSASPSYKVVLTGATGADESFSLSSTPAGVLTALNFTQTAASDAVLTVDGVTYTRSSNTVTDVVDGLTLNLLAASTSATISLARETTQVVSKIEALVAAYNEANSLFTEVTNPKSELDIYGATLVGDTTVRMVRTQLREALLGESSTPGTNVTAAWQMGLSVDKAGVMTLDTSKLATALTDNFDDVVTTFTANQNNRSATSPPYSSSTGYSSDTSSLNGGAAFTVTLTSSDGTAHGFPVTATNATPQGVVDAINATNLGYTAQLVQDTSGTLPYKIAVIGSIGGASFTLSAADADGDSVSDLTFSSSGSGIAGDTLRKITIWLDTTSPLTTQSVTAESQNVKYADQLAALQTRMDELLARYTKQFSAMESLVGSINSQKTSLKSTFEGMMSMYTNN
jgi:flagellar hook-associated protein 2